MQIQIRLLLNKQSDQALLCFDKYFVNYSFDNPHFIWEHKEKSVQNLRKFTKELNLIQLLLYYRYGDFSQFVEKVEELAKKLQDENLTSEEYKDLQAQFQVISTSGVFLITSIVKPV